MEWVETTGRSIEEAKDRALDQLGVDDSDAEFEVVSDAKTGLLGRLKVEARVRARVRPTTPRAKDTGNKRRRPRREDKRNDTSASEPSPAARPADSEDARSRPPRRKKSPVRDNEREAKVSDENVPLSEQGQVAEEFVSGFFSKIGSPVTITRQEDEAEDIVKLAVEGDDLGSFIGPRGSTLHSLQELTRTAVQRKTGSRSGRVVLDIAGYREKRRVALEQFSRQVAQQVVETESSRSLEPMNPADRKVVHDTINSIDGVVTTSEGEEPRRRVVISPA